MKRTLLIGLAVFVVVGSYFGYDAYRTAALNDWATNTALPAILAHASDEHFDEAFDLVLELQSKVGSSDLLEPHWSQFSTMVQAKTEPPGVDVYGRPYVSSDSDWRFVGTTPMEQRVAFGPKRWRFEKAGFETIIYGTPDAFIHVLEMPALQMTASDEVVPGMVPVAYAGLRGDAQVGRFQIARFEVTNREYLEFVEAGGYDDPNLWRDLDFVDGGRSLSFAEVQARFRDQTDRVGPATWEFGRFPTGKDDYPVAGVSWYEAVAYARYRGGVLPALYHWDLATYGHFSFATPLVAVMSSVANIGGRPIQKVGASDSMGTFGTYDMVGNVREWIWNKGATGRWMLGGSASQPDYMAVIREEVQPFDRSPENGLRLMIATDNISDDLLAPEVALPTSAEPPWPAVVYFPGGEFFISAEPDCMTRVRDSLLQSASAINPLKIPLEMGRDPINYLGRSTLPVLMLAGRLDSIFPVETNQRILFDMLGTPVEHKKLVIFEAGHGPLPRVPTLRAVADWLDVYLPQ